MTYISSTSPDNQRGSGIVIGVVIGAILVVTVVGFGFWIGTKKGQRVPRVSHVEETNQERIEDIYQNDLHETNEASNPNQRERIGGIHYNDVYETNGASNSYHAYATDEACIFL